MKIGHHGARRPGRAVATFLAATLIASACDLGVTNPATIADASLENRQVVPALANGAIAAVMISTQGTVGQTGGVFEGVALLTDELVHGGTELDFRELSDGVPNDERPETERRWSFAQRGRWTAEQAIARIGRLVPDSAKDSTVATVTLWAGYANRILGDNFCEAVIDGGPIQPIEEFHKRADARFTSAISLGTAANQPDIVTAAYAGRAQVRTMLGNWSGAVADAARVPTEYAFNMNLVSTSDAWNRFDWFANQNVAFVIWGTPFADLGRNTSITPASARRGDPRITYTAPLDSTGDYVKAADTRRPKWSAKKYISANDDIALAKGTEMRLIEAEAALVQGNWAAALAKINEVRAYANSLYGSVAPIAPVAGVGVDAVWTLLMTEKGVETYLEGRRLADLRRWSRILGTAKIPFTVVRKAAVGQPYTADERKKVTDVPRLCLPMSRSERLSNPNIPKGNP